MDQLALFSALAIARSRVQRDERGEGVISAAIAVLVMAFLGAGMWVAFNTLFHHAADKTGQQIEIIGGDSGNGSTP
jgi:hypothetical protein